MGKSKMCILHRSLNPVVTTAVSLPNAHAVWTVYGDDSALAHQQRGDERAQSEATEPDVMHHVAAAAGQQVTLTKVQIPVQQVTSTKVQILRPLSPMSCITLQQLRGSRLLVQQYKY
jgi:hypothetical protein